MPNNLAIFIENERQLVDSFWITMISQDILIN